MSRKSQIKRLQAAAQPRKPKRSAPTAANHQRVGAMLADMVEAQSPSPLDAARIVLIALLTILRRHLGDQGLLRVMRTIVAGLEASFEPLH